MHYYTLNNDIYFGHNFSQFFGKTKTPYCIKINLKTGLNGHSISFEQDIKEFAARHQGSEMANNKQSLILRDRN